MDLYEKAVALWKQKKIGTDAQLAEALNGQSVLFAYHSGNLENENITYHDTREIFDHDGVTSYTGDLRTLFEIRNAKDAYSLFLQAFGEQRPLDEALILSFQDRLTRNTYDTRRYRLGERHGMYKLHDYVTGKNEIGAAPEDVADEMQELLDELHGIPENRILRAAAYFHVKFENIHPFADGNGRTGRIAMNYFLIMNGHPPVTIHQEDRKEYYAALEAWDEEQQLAPMEQFLREQTVKTWEKQIARSSGGLSSRKDKPKSTLQSEKRTGSRKTNPKTMVYSFRIVYVGMEDRLWRDVEISSKYRLDQLGYLVLATFDTMAYHLFEILFGDRKYVLPDSDETPQHLDLADFTLEKLQLKPGDQLEMIYDYGTEQHFLLTVTNIREMKKGEGRHFPWISDMNGRGIIDDMSVFELAELVQQIDKNGKTDEPVYYTNYGEPIPAYTAPWDIRRFDLKAENNLLKGEIERIQDAYAAFWESEG